MSQCLGPRRPPQGRRWKFSMLVPSPDLRITQAGFRSKLHHGLVEWPWLASCLDSACFRFLIHKAGLMTILTQGGSEFSVRSHIK